MQMREHLDLKVSLRWTAKPARDCDQGEMSSPYTLLFLRTSKENKVRFREIVLPGDARALDSPHSRRHSFKRLA